jgi:hypothetical protein
MFLSASWVLNGLKVWVFKCIRNGFVGQFKVRSEILLVQGCSATAPVSYPTFIEEPPQ